MDGFNLLTQFVRHGWAVGFVFRVDIVSEGLAFGVKYYGHRAAGVVCQEAAQHTGHASNRTRILTRGRGEHWQCMKGPVDIGGAINQDEGSSGGIHSATYLYSEPDSMRPS